MEIKDDLKGLNMNNDFKKVLIIKYGAISEIIDSLPLIRGIKKVYPDTIIDYFTEEIPAKLISEEKNLREIYFVKNLSFKEIFKQVKKLKAERFDVVIDLNASIKSYILSVLSGAKQTITVESNQNISNSENYFKSVSEKIKGTEYNNDSEIYIPKEISENIQTAIPTQKDFVVLSTQTAKMTEGKKYRLEKFKELAEKLVEKYDIEVFVTGTAEERKPLSIFENINPKIHNFAGRFSILENAAFLKKAKCVIGIDSAPVYIAKSLNIPTIGLFGATSAEKKGFVGENVYPIYSTKLKCIPCEKKYCKLRNEEYSPCLDDISVTDITNLIDKYELLPLNL